MTAITVPVSFPGAQQSQTSMDALARAVAGLGTSVEGLTARQREQASSAQAAAQAQQTSAQQAIAFGQRIAGVANAVQALVGQLGGGSRTAGLIGSIANTSVQFAQLGAALGPEGALVGGIVGALVPALHELIESQDEAAQSAARLQEQQQHLREIQQSMAAGRADEVRRMVESGHVETLTEQELREQRLLTEDSLRREGEALDHLREAQQRAEQTGATATQGYHARAEGIAEATLRIQQYVAQLGNLGRAEAEHEAQAGRATVPGVTPAVPGTTPPTHHRGGGGGQSPEEREQARLLALIEQTNETRRLGQQIAEEYHATSEEGTKAEAEAERAYQAELRRTEREQAEADQHRHKEIQARLREEEQTKQKLQQEAQQRTQQGQEATSAIIGNLTNVFSIMAQGQMDAAHGAELLLAGFLQYISQRATIEALAQVAQGIGSYPDFGGMALHFAAAAAWGAVAVATGVGGAALASDAQSQAHAAQTQAQQPASPQHASGDDKGHASTYVINWNAPIYTGQDEAATGRVLRRMVDKATRRFPTA